MTTFEFVKGQMPQFPTQDQIVDIAHTQISDFIINLNQKKYFVEVNMTPAFLESSLSVCVIQLTPDYKLTNNMKQTSLTASNWEQTKSYLNDFILTNF